VRADRSHRSDLFSFGTILYDVLSGKRAYHGYPSVEIMNAILKQELIKRLCWF
jgi:hypothetical protein